MLPNAALQLTLDSGADTIPELLEPMVATLAAEPMAKPKRNDIPVKMDAEVVHTAKIVAAYRNISLAEYLSERFRDIIEADLAEHQLGGPPPNHKPRRKKE